MGILERPLDLPLLFSFSFFSTSLLLSIFQFFFDFFCFSFCFPFCFSFCFFDFCVLTSFRLSANSLLLCRERTAAVPPLADATAALPQLPGRQFDQLGAGGRHKVRKRGWEEEKVVECARWWSARGGGRRANREGLGGGGRRGK